MKRLLKVLLAGALGGALNAGATTTMDNQNVGTLVNAISVAVAATITLKGDKKKDDEE